MAATVSLPQQGSKSSNDFANIDSYFAANFDSYYFLADLLAQEGCRNRGSTAQIWDRNMAQKSSVAILTFPLAEPAGPGRAGLLWPSQSAQGVWDPVLPVVVRAPARTQCNLAF